MCAVIAADRGRETANFSSGERKEGAGRKVLMSRIVEGELKYASKRPTGTKGGKMTD